VFEGRAGQRGMLRFDEWFNHFEIRTIRIKESGVTVFQKLPIPLKISSSEKAREFITQTSD
jgi:hypothetical protein